MSEYKTNKLGDVCEILNGRAYKQKELLDSGKYKVLRVGNFFSNNSWYFSDLELEDNKYCDFGDLLFAWSASFGPRIWKGNKTIYHYHIWKMVVDDNEIDKLYLYYYLHNKSLSFMSSTHGSIMLHLTKSFMSDLLVQYPKEVIYQKQIAKVLSDLDAKIEVNNKINQQLEAMAKTLYDYWFVQFDFPTTNVSSSAVENSSATTKPYKSSGGKMIYNEELKREIPNGWESGVFGDYVKAKGGYAFKSAWWTDNGLSVIKIKDIDESYSIDISNCSYVGNDKLERCKDFQAKAGDVLLAMTGATVGKFGIVPKSDIHILVNQRVAHYRLGDNPVEKLPYLIKSLSQDYFRETIFVVASGAAQPNISSDQLDAIPLVKPKQEIIDSFNKKLASSYEKILNNKAENQKLVELRDWLLPMLMNGQVQVNSSDAGAVAGGLGMVAESGVEYKKGK